MVGLARDGRFDTRRATSSLMPFDLGAAV